MTQESGSDRLHAAARPQMQALLGREAGHACLHFWRASTTTCSCLCGASRGGQSELHKFSVAPPHVQRAGLEGLPGLEHSSLAQILAEAPSGAVTTADLDVDRAIAEEPRAMWSQPMCSVTSWHETGTQSALPTCSFLLVSSSPAVRPRDNPVCSFLCCIRVLHVPPVGAG